MNRLYFYVFLQALSLPLVAQFQDDFSGPALAVHWQGDTDRYILNTGELQLSDEMPGSANESSLYALAPTSTANETTWTILARMAFAPSSSNFAKVYLTADQPPVSGANFNGYYLRLGGISGDQDALELYRQDGASSTLLISGIAGGLGGNPALIRILVTRSMAGEWTLEADYTGGEDYETEGTAMDATYSNGLFFGLSCVYTSSRAMSFFFDDVEVGPIVQDQDGPVLVSVEALSATSLRVLFNEPLDEETASSISNYSLDPGSVGPLTAELEDGSLNAVILTFADPFINLQEYTLEANGITDLSGNTTANQQSSFTFFLPEEPASGDLIFTEIMADPTPAVGLPAEEYVEVYNASQKVLQLEGYGLSTGSSAREIGEAILLPGEYVLLCDDDDVSLYSGFGKVAALTSFPSLTNGGSYLGLLSPDSDVIAELTYSDDWYRDEIRSDGGYSLELIDLSLAPDCPGNWRASIANLGGTPAQENSLFGEAVDDIPPGTVNAFAPVPTEVIIRFDDVLDLSVEDTGLFSIDPAIGVGDVLTENNRQSVRLFLEEALQPGTVYTITINSGVEDCLGNASTSTSQVVVGVAEDLATGDLILNEILFNPRTGGVDFVELYNTSEKILNLKGVRLRNEIIESGTIATQVVEDFLLIPDAYAVFTPDRANILENYVVPNPGALVENSLPSLGDKDGNISVYTDGFTLLDSLTYNQDWHSALLSDRNGVSLERLRADGPTQDAGNWHSAAAAVGYATPTGENSQDRETVIPPTGDDLFSLPEETFSPDQDGFQDVLEIQYSTDRAGYITNILIFDGQGRQVRRLQRAELLAGSGSFLWDGTRDDGSRARIGIYIVWLETFTPDGNTRQQRLTCVLAGRLD